MTDSEAKDDCIFCRIIKGEDPASMVFEDERVIALLDIEPVNGGHAMVIPKEHVPLLADLDPELGSHIFRVAQKLAQAIPHLHLHGEDELRLSPRLEQLACGASSSAEDVVTTDC